MTHSPDSIIQVAGLAAVGLMGAIVGFQKILKGWKETSTESSILTMMHDELNRMSSHNKILAEELSKFQLEVIKLNNQLTDLTMENHRLHNEIVALTREVNRLQRIIEETSVSSQGIEETQGKAKEENIE